MSGPATEKLLRLVRPSEPAVSRLFRLTFSDPSNYTRGEGGRLTGSVPEATSGRSGAAGKGGKGPVTATVAPKTFQIITEAEARGTEQGVSRAVSAEEFQTMAATGRAQLDTMEGQPTPATGLTGDSLDAVKASTYAACQEPWGGATIDAHTGEALVTKANVFAVTARPEGDDPISVPIGSSKDTFNAAMDTAVARYQPLLQGPTAYLGVFRDEDENRIDIDPVVTVTSRGEADNIGAATHAIGGAYNFMDGWGYFPPHVAGS